MSGRAAEEGQQERWSGRDGAEGGGGQGAWRTGAAFSQIISRLSISNKSRDTTPLAAPIIREPPRSQPGHLVSRQVGSIVITHTGDEMQGAEGRDSIFVRKISTGSSSRASIAGHLFGLTRQPPSLDAVIRKTRKRSTAEDDGLTKVEIENVRERCKRMIAAAEAAGGTESWENARKALLATVFETHPTLEEGDLQTYLSLRGLDNAEEVDPERIRELAVALFLLIRKRPLTFDSVVRVAYSIFDQDGDGELDKDEFQQLMNATLRTHLTLDFVLRLPAGKEAFLRHLKEEYAEENFYFWQSSEQFASSLPTVAKAQTLYDGYIREGAPKQVNISAQTNEGIRKKWHAVQNGEAPLTRKLFTAAQAEVFNLMQKDNFERFRKNTKRMEDFVDCMFKEVDRSNNGRVSLEEYTEWATNNRDVMGFMRATGGKVAVIRGLPTKNAQGEGGSGGKDSGARSRDGDRGTMAFLSAAIKDTKKVKRTRLVYVRSNPSSLPPSSSWSSSSSSSSDLATLKGHVPKSRNGSELALGGGASGGGGGGVGVGGVGCGGGDCGGDGGDGGDGGGGGVGLDDSSGASRATTIRGADNGGSGCCAAFDDENSNLHASVPLSTFNPTPTGTSTTAACPALADRGSRRSSPLPSPVFAHGGVSEGSPSCRRSFSGVDGERRRSWRVASCGEGGSGVGRHTNEGDGDDWDDRGVCGIAERNTSSIAGSATASNASTTAAAAAAAFFVDVTRRIRQYLSSFRKFSEFSVQGKRRASSRYRPCVVAPSTLGAQSGLEPAIAGERRISGAKGGIETL